MAQLPTSRRRWIRPPILAAALLCLVAGIWAGWLRLGWAWPGGRAGIVADHGPLMIVGFLTALIALERAVAMGRRWMYAAPILAAAGGLAVLVGAPRPIAAVLSLGGAALLLGVMVSIVRRDRGLHTWTMALGAAALLVGDLLWLGWPLPMSSLVLWWSAFPVLTVAGERLELGRVLRPSRRVRRAFAAIVALAMLSLATDLATRFLGTVFYLIVADGRGPLALGGRMFGLALLLLAIWLWRYDLARRTIRQSGLTRFVAACLLAGYAWLGFAGVVAMVRAPLLTGGYVYDAFLHAVLVGFTISMIFGHAPLVLPAVLGLPIGYGPIFYGPLALLHASLLLRVAGDLAMNDAWRRWGGLLNGVAILLFLAVTAATVAGARTRAAARATGASRGASGAPSS